MPCQGGIVGLIQRVFARSGLIRTLKDTLTMYMGDIKERTDDWTGDMRQISG